MSTKEYTRQYYLKNKKRILAQNKKRHKEHPEIYKKWYTENKELLSKKAKAKKIADGWKPKTDWLYTKRICRTCKEPSEHLMNHTKGKNGKQYFICRKCNTDIIKKYRQTENGKEHVKKAVAKSTQKFMYKHLARMKVRDAVKYGRLIKPKRCSHCEKIKKVEGHHEDYSKPLEVIWVCRQCHFDYYK